MGTLRINLSPNDRGKLALFMHRPMRDRNEGQNEIEKAPVKRLIKRLDEKLIQDKLFNAVFKSNKTPGKELKKTDC